MTKSTVTLNEKKKNRRKVYRVIIQLIIIMAAIIFFASKVLNLKQYEEPAKEKWINHDDFIAISYFGVGRIDSPKLLSKERLQDQLNVLHKAGYETVSQQDIKNFYDKSQPLPDKALFLSFEDGRNDSALFSQPLLENYNYKASMLTYANRLGDKDHKFLQPKDLKEMEKTGYWEMGTNGYRLSYINIVTDKKRYLGEKAEKEIPNKMAIEYYNHYLMDFIRDKDMIPKENYDEMAQRITKDYDLMQKEYKEQMDEVPQLYMIMHANTMYNSMHELVEKVNDKNIKRLFSLHFNRDGYAKNTKRTSPYNLTRLQVNPSWSMNQFIMRVNDGLKYKIEYEHGDIEQYKQWQEKNGVAQFDGNQVILTTKPNKVGSLTWKEEKLKDVQIEATVKGKVMGEQSIILRQQNDDEYIRVAIKNNKLQIYESVQAKERLLKEEKLNKIKWQGEDYAFSKARTYSQIETLQGSSIDKDEYPSGIDGSRKLSITLQGESLSVKVDDLSPLTTLVTVQDAGQIRLSAAPYQKKTAKETKHEEKLIYDGVFEDLVIKSKEQEKYTMKYSGTDLITNEIKKAWNGTLTKIMEWF